MAQTYTQLTYHFVFGSKDRLNLLDEPVTQRLYPFLTAMINNELGFTRIIGGMPDHLHILADLSPKVTVSEVLRDLKGRSSSWLRREFPALQFSWQEGYGAFTVSASVIDKVQAYIQNQKQHHEKQDFRTEFVTLVQRHGLTVDEASLWK